MEDFGVLIAADLRLSLIFVQHTIKLLQGGATIPFISRYRKEATGGMNELQIEEVQSHLIKYTELAKRKTTIITTISEQGKLTEELRSRIESCWDVTEIEDIYLPFKPKRKTRAEVARQKGLEPLASLIMMQHEPRLETHIRRFINNEVSNEDEALKGARDIIAELVSENEDARNIVRRQFERTGRLKSRVIKSRQNDETALKYRDYFDFEDSLRKCSSHRLLAIRRGEAEGILKVNISPVDDDECIRRVERIFVKSHNSCGIQVKEAVGDAYKRLLRPAIETEFVVISKVKADEEAIRVFAENLCQLLLAPPLGQKRVMGIDPGFRTGCKVVCLDQQGNLLHNETIYPHPPHNKVDLATKTLQKLVEQYKIEAFAIGNGTAGRETEQLVSSLRYTRSVQIFLVNEDGASIYSASKIAREEFPDYDVTVRGAVSIGRRLMDPLAELVKIDAKSIGVGQYQHDVNQVTLKSALDRTVESCVNLVGVNLNTASQHLLTYVSGVGPTLARNIVDYRAEHGAFHSRKELMNVPRMGEKAFEQCAGFLRISEANNPLDNSAVHPERYHIVEQMAHDLKCTVQDLITNKELRDKIKPERYLTADIGLPTLNDILQELDKPGRDPRQAIQEFEFDKNIRTFDDLCEGMELPGIITNITNFGCFVDLGIKENGLIHISQITDKYITDPSTIIRIHQQVRVRIIGLDIERHRIQLSMKGVIQK